MLIIRCVSRRVRIVTVSFGDDIDPLGIKSVSAYDKSFLDAKEVGMNIKVLLLCSPHNPLGIHQSF
jgi:hypothetical protein